MLAVLYINSLNPHTALGKEALWLPAAEVEVEAQRWNTLTSVHGQGLPHTLVQAAYPRAHTQGSLAESGASWRDVYYFLIHMKVPYTLEVALIRSSPDIPDFKAHSVSTIPCYFFKGN